MTADTLVLLAALALVVVLLVLLLVRRPRVDLPPEWLARLQTLERTSQATQLAVAKNDGAMDALAKQLGGFTQTTQHTLETLRHAVDERLAQAVTESRNGRAELLGAFGVFESRLEQRQTALDASLAQRFDGLQHAVAGRLEESSKALLAHLAQGQADSAAARKELSDTLIAFRTELTATTGALAAESVKSREAMGESAALFEKRIQERFEALTAATRLTLDSLKGDIQTQLGSMSSALKDQLEANGFQIKNQFSVLQDAVSQQLTGLVQGSQHNAEQLRIALNERLGAIIDNVLTPDQFARNVKTVPGSDELVEFAIRLPGKSDEHPVWLPIDSKYPVEQYQRLMDAQDAADKVATLSAGNAFETSIKLEAKKIFAKYVSPPNTTDFAILYLPTEGLFAEVMRRPGLVEAVQNDCRVMITGPANLAAMLNSLQMGFKTLAIEKRSSEVWSLLGMVKTEFAKFGDVVEATKKSIDAAAKKFDEVGVRTRAIQRKLRDVQDLPAPDTAVPLARGHTAALTGLDPEDDLT